MTTINITIQKVWTKLVGVVALSNTSTLEGLQVWVGTEAPGFRSKGHPLKAREGYNNTLFDGSDVWVKSDGKPCLITVTQE